MEAVKRIPVTEEIWAELGQLKRAGQTYNDLIEELLDEFKKSRLFVEMKKIEEDGEFVELD